MSKHALSTGQAPRRTTYLQLVKVSTHSRSLQAWAAVDGTSPITSEKAKGKQEDLFCFLQTSALSK